MTPTPPLESPAALVDLERYPLLDPESERMRAILQSCRAAMRETGACEIPGFLSASGLEAVLADARELATRAHRSEGYGTAYLDVPDPSLPEDHPRRYLGKASVGVIAYDMFPPESPLRRLYEWAPMMDFISAILERGPLHRYADPLGALNLAVMGDGDELQWHFDMTDFVVSLAIQDAERGGDFVVVPHIRTADDEHYDDVREVVQERSRRVMRLPMVPGTLLVFEGRHSIHRVTRIEGRRPRLVGLLAYDTRPGTCSTELLRLARYGRTG